ncbi:MAG: hypothetical protein QOJ32_1991, partial [Frankiaceae bacterium]|nr:hypothetical protein [Frankiaceae bacterium]
MRRTRQLARTSDDEFGLLLEVTESARTRPQRQVLLTGCLGLARLLWARVSAFLPEGGDDGLLLAVDRGVVRLPGHRSGELARLLDGCADVAARSAISGLVPAQRAASPV